MIYTVKELRDLLDNCPHSAEVRIGCKPGLIGMRYLANVALLGETSTRPLGHHARGSVGDVVWLAAGKRTNLAVPPEAWQQTWRP